jgi:partner of Y14 and mago protein
MDANALPKGHIIGWAPPPAATDATKSGDANTAAPSSGTTPMTKAAKKNAKRKEKREKERAEKEKEDVPENWEDEGEVEVEAEQTMTDEKVQQDAEDTLSSQLEILNVN